MDLTNLNFIAGMYGGPGYVTTTGHDERKPDVGQIAPAQQTGEMFGGGIGTSVGAVAGYRACPEPSIETFREMLCDPTIAIGLATIAAPIIAGSWKYVAKEGASDKAVELIRDTFEPQRVDILRDALRSLAFGWYPFEKVWDIKKSMYVTRLRGLLPELCRVMIDKKSSLFAGIKAGEKDLPPEKSWLITYDREGDNFYGRARLKNSLSAWHEWNEIARKAGQLATKAASIIPIVHYPPGTTLGPNGIVESTFQSGQSVLNRLSTGNGILIPNLAGDVGQLMANPALAGKSAWVISFLEAAGAAQALSGLTERQRYLDSLKLRGLFVPERAVTEASLSGSRADAENSADIAMLMCEQIHSDIVRAMNKDGGVREMLVFNFGQDAADSVTIEANKLDDKKRAVFKQLFAAVLAMPYVAEDLLTQIDMDAVCDEMGLPKLNKNKSIELAAVPSEATQGTPGATNPDGTPVDPAAQAIATNVDNRLNGAQITAAVDLLVQLRQGILTPNTAIELLIAVGIDDATARKMVGEIKAAGPLETNDGNDNPSDDEQNSNPNRP
jgi:hypothetical protein